MRTPRLTRQWQELPREAIRHLQSEKLRHYLREVVIPFSAYYRTLFKKEGLTADSVRSVEDLEKLPFTCKNDLVNTPDNSQRAMDFLIVPNQETLRRRPSTVVRALALGRETVRRQFASEFRPIFLTSTTGRSADPIPFLFTEHDLNNLSLAGKRAFEVCGARPEFRLLNMLPYAPHLAFWFAHYGSTAFGVFMASSGGGKVMGTEGQLRFLRKIKPEIIIGMPTFVYHVLHQAVDSGIRCEHLRRVVLAGEKVPEGMRRKLRHLAGELGAGAIDVIVTYGFTEAKMAWGECLFPHDQPSAGYHLYPDLGIMEVIDPSSGQVVPDGHPGELVFTPLASRGTVVLRYRTGDFIEGGLTWEPCPYCNRRVPRLVGNISRSAEVKSMQLGKIKGTLVDFNQLEHLLDDVEHIGAWQLELRKYQDDPLEVDELILHVQKQNGVDEQKLVRDLRTRCIARTEIQPNRILFHSGEEMRQLHGVGTQLKEQKIVDNRPGGGKSPARINEKPPDLCQVTPLHEPGPLTPSLSPSTGERVSAGTGEGVAHGVKARTIGSGGSLYPADSSVSVPAPAGGESADGPNISDAVAVHDRTQKVEVSP